MARTATAKQARVLVVDDDRSIATTVARRLRRWGYSAETAGGGSEALELLRSADPAFDLVLLDVRMPGLGGRQVVERIRSSQKLADLGVIMVSAEAESHTVVRCLEVGADDYVTKPIDFPVLQARIRNQIARRSAEDGLRSSEQRYALAAAGAHDGLWDWDLERDRLFLSSRWKAMLGYAERDLAGYGAEWYRLIHPADVERVRSTLREHVQGATEHLEVEHRMRRRDGTYIWVLTRGVAVRDTHGRPTRMAGSQTDLSRPRLHDSLTRLPNRTFFLEQVAAALSPPGGGPARPFAVVFIHIADLARVTESLGHGATDRVMLSVVRRLRGLVNWWSDDTLPGARDNRPPVSVVARFEGAQLGMLCQGFEHEVAAIRVAEQVRELLSQRFGIDGTDVRLACNVGIAFGAPHYLSAEAVLRDAHAAARRAKVDSTGCAIFQPEMHDEARERLRFEAELSVAVTSKQLFVEYQPIVALHTLRVVKLEALVRWNHPTRGRVPPTEFIAVAEETRLISALGSFVLEEACKAAAGLVGNVSVSVNVSAHQLARPGFVARVARTLEMTGLPAERLELELTESAFLDEAARATSALRLLTDLGVRLAIDDFGTGYSSLSYLRRLPIQTIKIDKSFVRNMMDDPDDAAITRTIVVMAHQLGLSVTAEGVEEPEQAQMLAEIGCDTLQGYLFGRPMPLSDVEELLGTGMRPAATGTIALAPPP